MQEERVEEEDDTYPTNVNIVEESIAELSEDLDESMDSILTALANIRLMQKRVKNLQKITFTEG